MSQVREVREDSLRSGGSVVIGSSRLIREGRHLLSRLDVFSLLFDVPLLGLFQVLVLEILGDLVGFATGRDLD